MSPFFDDAYLKDWSKGDEISLSIRQVLQLILQRFDVNN